MLQEFELSLRILQELVPTVLPAAIAMCYCPQREEVLSQGSISWERVIVSRSGIQLLEWCYSVIEVDFVPDYAGRKCGGHPQGSTFDRSAPRLFFPFSSPVLP